MCNDERLRGVVLSELQAKVKGILENFETPRNIRLVADQVCSFKKVRSIEGMQTISWSFGIKPKYCKKTENIDTFCYHFAIEPR